MERPKSRHTVSRGAMGMGTGGVSLERSSAFLCADFMQRSRELVYERSLRKHWRTFVQDVACLLCGVRSCVLLDYLQIPPPRLKGQLTPLWKRWPILSTLHVLELLDGIFLLRWDLLEPRLLREVSGQTVRDQGPPIFIRIDNGPPTITGQEETQRIFAHLSRFVVSIQKSVSMCLSRTSTLNCAGPCTSLPSWLDLTLPEAWGAAVLNSSSLVPFPTLAGWLLGYPAIYLFNLYNGDLAARALSSASLQVYDITVSSEQLCQASSGIPSTPSTPRTPSSSSTSSCASTSAGPFSILRFSVPTDLLAERELRSGGVDLRRVLNQGANQFLNNTMSNMNNSDQPMRLSWAYPELSTQIRPPGAVAL